MSQTELANREMKADFDADPVKGRAPLKVRFADRSQGVSVGQYWDFGDGETSVKLNPIHVYDKPGRYTVTLVKMGAVASDEVTRDGIVQVTS